MTKKTLSNNQPGVRECEKIEVYDEHANVKTKKMCEPSTMVGMTAKLSPVNRA